MGHLWDVSVCGEGVFMSSAHFESMIAYCGINPFSWKISLEKLELHSDDELVYGGY